MDVFAIATHTAPLLRSGRGRRAAPGEGPAFRGNLTHPHPTPSPAAPERGYSGREFFTMATHTAPLLRTGRGQRPAPREAPALPAQLTYCHADPPPPSTGRRSADRKT